MSVVGSLSVKDILGISKTVTWYIEIFFVWKKNDHNRLNYEYF